MSDQWQNKKTQKTHLYNVVNLHVKKKKRAKLHTRVNIATKKHLQHKMTAGRTQLL